MKQKRLLIFTGVCIVLAAVLIAVVVLNKNKAQIATSYKDASGWVYECSQPIAVEDQGVKYMSGKPSLTPVDESDASKYCHRVGIE
jgi:hypothetical protein